MKVAYFDCFSGAAGDMMMGSLVDAGLDPDDLIRNIYALGMPDLTIKFEKVKKNGISATQTVVLAADEDTHRHLGTITDLIGGSSLPDGVKEQSIAVFTKLARAEAKIHGTGIDQVHFHETGALDAIADIVGSVSGLNLLGVDAIYSSPVNVGAGTVTCAHGIIPVPAPASLELLKGKPVYSSGTRAELVTPTGAALLATLSTDFGPFVPMKVKRIGYGAGNADLDLPNLLRVTVGESLDFSHHRIRPAAEGTDHHHQG